MKNQEQQLTKNFALSEWAVSRDFPELAAKINFSEVEIERIRMFVLMFLQPLREALGTPIVITSGKRSKQLNSAVKGSPGSKHLFRNGSLAVDITAPRLQSISTICQWIDEEYSFNGKHFLRNYIFYPDQNFIHISAPIPGDSTGGVFLKSGGSYHDLTP